MRVSRRILVVRACAIGDFILNLPALRALALQNPAAQFTLVGYPDTLSLAESFIPVESIQDIESPPWSALFVRPVTPLGFDKAWVWMKDPTLAENLRQSGVGEVFHAPAFPQNQTHAADYLLATTGLPAPDLPDLWSPESERVIIHPGSGSPEKVWPWFEDLANEIPNAAVIAGPCEKHFRTRHPRLEGLSLRAVADQIRSCRIFIGSDSGITHLAAYWGCPTVALFGPTNPRVWGPIGRRTKILWRTPLSDISVSEVRNLL